MSKSLTIKEPDDKQMLILHKTSGELFAIAQKITINSQPKLDEAQISLKRIRDGQKFIKADLKQFLDPLKFITEKIKSKYQKTEEELKQADFIISKKIMDYKTSLTQAIEVKKQEIVKEVESGEMSFETASKKLEKQEVKIDNFKTRKISDIEITDELLIPREYLIPDRQKIKKAILDDGKEIPGARKIIREILIT